MFITQIFHEMLPVYFFNSKNWMLGFTNALNIGILLVLISQNISKNVSVFFPRWGGGEELEAEEALRKV